MCVYIWKASAYEIEDRGTSGNTASEDILREKGFFLRVGGFKYSKMYIKAWHKGSKTENSTWGSLYILENSTFFCIDKAGEKEA